MEKKLDNEMETGFTGLPVVTQGFQYSAPDSTTKKKSCTQKIVKQLVISIVCGPNVDPKVP